MSAGFLDSLQVFYSRLFPFEAMHRWLAYGTGEDLAKSKFFHREFSFTLENDVYIRYLSFRNAQEFKQMVLEKKPHKIDIGAIYTCPAKDHLSVSSQVFKPTHRELVFDIDFTDYSDVVLANTSQEGIWGNHAWEYMKLAVKVLDRSLREDFGYQHVLFVFSGRRGIHCWVCDPEALELEDSERVAICDYLTLVVKDSKMARLTTPVFPALKKSLDMCRPVFDSVASKFCFSCEAEWTKVLEFVPNHGQIRLRMQEEWKANASATTGEKKWAQLVATVRDVAQRENKLASDALMRSLDAIVLHYTYPRLDVNVSTHRNHLLKSPFVIHPKTGNVCVPIFDVESFHPDQVPNLTTLLRELDNTGTCALAGVVKRFESDFLLPLESTLNEQKRARESQQRQAKRAQQDKASAESGEW